MSIETSACASVTRPSAIEPGDFVLSFAHGYYKHQVIKRIQGARLRPEHRRYSSYTHAALVVSPDGDLLEAFADGVQRSHLNDLAGRPHQVVHIDASREARERAVAVALHALDRNARYNAAAMVSAALSAVSGCRLVLSSDGAHTCSGFVARALLAVGAIYDVDAAKVTPAQLAIQFGAPAPPAEPVHARRFRDGLGWDVGASAGC